MTKRETVLDDADFRNLFQATPDPTVVSTEGGRVVALNAAASTLLERELEGLTLANSLPREAATPPTDPGRDDWRLLEALTSAGRRLSLRIRTFAFQSQGERLIVRGLHTPGVADGPHDAQHRLAAIVEGSNDAIISVSLDGTILTWNRAADRVYGYAAHEMVGHPVSRLIPSDRQNEEALLLAQVRRRLTVEHYETVRLRKDGSPVDISLTISPVLDDTGNVVGASKIARDISRRKRQDALLERQRQALAESNAALEQFAYVASHDLQEPLRMVASYTQLLQRRYQGRLDEDADEFIAYAVDGARRMQALIQDLLAYSRIRSRPEKRVPCDMQRSLAQALSNLHGAVSESRARVESSALPTVLAVPAHMLQLLQNLIGNALKFRSDGPPHVRVQAYEDDRHWHFTVADNGIGIEPEFAERIFGIFQRLHGVGTYPGTGIGLAICRQIAEQHGGRIWVEPNEGGGAVFHFTISREGEDDHDHE